MYQKILVAVDNTKADESLLPHITRLAKMLDSKILLVHVADGWAARNFEQLQLTESEEMKADKAYLEKVAARLREQGLQVTCLLAMGNPPDQILKVAGLESCDLIALATHGHRFLGDLIYGSTIEKVRHGSQVPLLVVRATDLGANPL
jgi:nucleotide-binding universal stress UspA family protein